MLNFQQLLNLVVNQSLYIGCKMKKCKQCKKQFKTGQGSQNNPDFCCDDCNYDYHKEQLGD